MQSRTPVLVLAGFLGSGKTTLLNHLLGHSLDLRIGVIVNDFGSIGVDAMLVGGSAGDVVAMGNGCICCATDEEGLAPLLESLSRPGSGIDVIVIEASGIADPGALVQLVLTSGGPHTTFGGLVEVVDVTEFENTRARHPELDRHVELADMLVLNKADRADADQLERVSRLCRAANGHAPIVATSHGVVDPRVLFDVEVVPGRQLMLGQAHTDNGDDGHGDHLHAAYDALSFVTDAPVDPRRLVALLDERPPGLYRVKGVVHFGVTGHRQRFVVHAVGRYLRFDRTPWPRGQPRRTSLDVIGLGMSGSGVQREELTAALRACERTEPADPDDMLAVLRYTFSAR